MLLKFVNCNQHNPNLKIKKQKTKHDNENKKQKRENQIFGNDDDPQELMVAQLQGVPPKKKPVFKSEHIIYIKQRIHLAVSKFGIKTKSRLKMLCEKLQHNLINTGTWDGSRAG